MAPASSLGQRHDPQRCLGFKPRSRHNWVCFTFLKQFLTCKTELAGGGGVLMRKAEEGQRKATQQESVLIIPALGRLSSRTARDRCGGQAVQSESPPPSLTRYCSNEMFYVY